MKLKTEESFHNEVYISTETEDQIISYNNIKGKDFNWGSVSIKHKNSQRTLMYYFVNGDKVPYKYKDQIETIEKKWSEFN